MSVNTSELRKWQADLERTPARAVPGLLAVLRKGSLNVKRDWQRAWRGHAHIPALPSAISYDVTRSRAGLHAEIGVDKVRAQGPLGNIIEFGTLKNAPIPGGLPALSREIPNLEREIGRVMAEALGDG